MARRVGNMLYSAPWIHPDSYPELDSLGWADIAGRLEAIPPGVLARHGTSPRTPAKVPDLIGIQERRYFDSTGLMHHRDIGDLMRYAAMNQDGDILSRYGSFVPLEALPLVLGKVPADPAKLTDGRYSDEQLYALALFLYSLRRPANPNQPDALTAEGKKIFEREACAACHAPPLYTNNQRTPAVGYQPSPEVTDVVRICVGTDPALAMKTRRGTGYYKVPSLKGVWYRTQFEHSGSVATLEDWFDKQRLRDDYVPTGFEGYGVTTRAVKGHEFGLQLPAVDRRALIAFLKTL
jgi:cytochrome c553